MRIKERKSCLKQFTKASKKKSEVSYLLGKKIKFFAKFIERICFHDRVRED